MEEERNYQFGRKDTRPDSPEIFDDLHEYVYSEKSTCCLKGNQIKKPLFIKKEIILMIIE